MNKYSFRDVNLIRFFWIIFLYTLLWSGINSSPWVLSRFPSTFLSMVHYVRTVSPLFILCLLPLAIIQYRQSKVGSGPVPVGAWLLYGIVGGIACLVSPRPMQALYWAGCYLAVFVPVYLCIQGENAVNKIILLNYCGWIITSVILVIMLFAARDALFVDHRGGITGYGILRRAGSVADISISRSSGMARFAAVPGVIAFVFFISQKGLKRFVWLLPFFGSCTLVWFMQSRGAILALLFSLSFIMLFFSMRIRLFGIVMMLLMGTAYWTGNLPEHTITYAKEHFYRGQTNEELRSLTGRTRVWKKAAKEVKKSSFIGHGPQADRYLIKEHVHNTYYYTLLESGILGTFFFVGGLIWAWILFFKAVFQTGVDRLGQRPFLMQVGGILAFFTIRSIPEVCGAMYSVDLMVMLPALGYLQVLSRQVDHLPMSEARSQV